MNFIRTLWAKWQTSRLFCAYCGEVPVERPGMLCSENCRWASLMEDRAA